MFKKIAASFVLSLTALSAFIPVMAAEPVAGRQYTILEKPVADAPEVVEFFSFYCPPCAAFAGIYNVSEAIDNVLPKGKKVEKYHVAAMGEMGEMLTQAWSIAKVLNVESLVEKPLFIAVQQKKNIKTRDDIRRVFIESGVPAKQYDAAANSLVVKAMTEKQKKAAKDFGVTGTPSFYVGGRYLIRNGGISPATPDEYGRAFADVISALLTPEHKKD